jgi:DnaJ-class molecular chaperone
VICEQCGGTGSAVAACKECGGSGEIEVEREVELTVPSGVEDGARVPLGAEGEHVVVRVRQQPREPALLRVAAALGLVAALGFLAFLLLG